MSVFYRKALRFFSVLGGVFVFLFSFAQAGSTQPKNVAVKVTEKKTTKKPTQPAERESVLVPLDFQVPDVKAMERMREQEKWACSRQAGHHPPTSKTCVECPRPPDGADPVDTASAEFRRWLSANLVDFGIHPPLDCQLPSLLVTKEGERIDRESCPPHLIETLRNESVQSARSFVLAGNCLARLNPDLFRITESARQQLGNPLYSCYQEGNSGNLQYWEAQCRSRIKNPASPQAVQSIAACVDFFKRNQRITIQHPVFPDRWILRVGADSQRVIASPSAVARVQFREIFARSGLDADSTLADGCLGACGSLPGSAYVATLEGCQLCATHGRDSGAARQSVLSCQRMGLDAMYRDVSDYRNYEECAEAVDQGDRSGLTRACGRLRKTSVFEHYCKKFKQDLVACLKDRESARGLREILFQAQKNSLKILMSQEDWVRRSAY